jgi:hypothetical protein
MRSHRLGEFVAARSSAPPSSVKGDPEQFGYGGNAGSKADFKPPAKAADE